MAVLCCSGHAQDKPARVTANPTALIMASHPDLCSDLAIICSTLLCVGVNRRLLRCEAITICSKAGNIWLSSSSSGS